MDDKTTIYFNGNIITMSDEKTKNAAMVVKGNKVIDFLDKEEFEKISKQEKEGISFFDLKGSTILPGLNDSHCHITRYGVDLTTVNLNGVKTEKEISDRIKKYIEKNDLKEGDWIIGKGWDEEKFLDNKMLDKKILDNISEKYPMYLLRKCCHIACVNSYALKLLKISKDTIVPDGGKIIKSESGELNGLFIEAAVNLIIEKLPKYSKEKLKEIIYIACTEAKKYGLTSVQTEDFKYIGDYNKVIQAYKELYEENRLPIRVHLKMFSNNPVELKEIMKNEYVYMKENFNELLSCGTFKVQLDGILGTNTAYLKDNYIGQSEKGMIFHNKKELMELMEIAYENNIQTACHCIGDKALEIYLEAIEDLNKKYVNCNLRQRAVHCSITDEDLLNDMAKLNVNANIQLISLASDYKILENKVGFKKAKTSYAWKTMHKKGIVVSGSSDCPSESINPFEGMYVGITRTDFEGNPQGGYNPSEKLTREEVLKMYTINSAYVCNKEKELGSLEIGKLADFIIIDKNLMEINEEEIPNIKVRYSSVNGILEKIN